MYQHCIPLHPQQIRCDSKDLDHLLHLREREIIRWTFAPFGNQPGLDPLSADEQAFSNVVNEYCGTKTRRLVPQVRLAPTIVRSTHDRAPDSLILSIKPATVPT